VCICVCVHFQNVTELQFYTFPVVFIAIYSFLLADGFLSVYEASNNNMFFVDVVLTQCTLSVAQTRAVKRVCVCVCLMAQP